MRQIDEEDKVELEELKKLVSGKKLNLPTEQLEPREAIALLRYIDELEGAEDVLTYDQSDLKVGLRKLVGIAAARPDKTARSSQDRD